MKFINKTAVITGAAGGIGTAITQRFLNEGAGNIILETGDSMLIEKENLPFLAIETSDIEFLGQIQD